MHDNVIRERSLTINQIIFHLEWYIEIDIVFV